MIAVDTNILVRILVNDSKQVEQVNAARELAQKAKQIFLPQIVQIELIWVLESGYKLQKHEILSILDNIAGNEGFILQNKLQFEAALHLYRTTHAGFADCLILVESQQSNCNKLVTFDKKFAKLIGVELLK